MSDRQALVVAGRYEVIRCVRQALRGRGFAIKVAYSHRDAEYALRQGRHDVAIVDAIMFDRHSGAMTLPTLARMSLCPPLVAIVSNGAGLDVSGLPVAVTPVSLDEGSVQRGVMQALRIPVISHHTVELGTAGGLALNDKEVQTLLALGRSLTEVLNMSEVLNRVVEAARFLTDAEEGLLLLPDPQDGDLYLRAKVGIDVEVARNFRVRTNDTLAGSVYKSGKPTLIGASGPLKVKTEYFVNSLLYVPILLQGEPIGVLGVNNKIKHDVFDAHHQEVLMQMAAYAAIAIENARIHEESLKQARELKALVDASQTINASLALERMLPSICQQLIDVLGVQRVDILEWHRPKGQLRTLARCQQAVWRAGHEPKIDLSRRPALHHVLKTRQPLLVDTDSAGIAGKTELLTRTGAGAALLLPLGTGEQVYGAVQVYFSRSPEAMPSDDMLQKAQHVALQPLLDLSSQNGKSSPQHVFRLVDDLNNLLHADWSEYLLLEADTTLTLHVVRGMGLWLEAPYPTLDLGQYPDLLDALQTQTLIGRQHDSTAPEGERALLNAMRARSLIGLPLVYRGQAQGMIVVADVERPSPFGEREIDLARAIVGQAATALENARLFHDLEASLKELKETQERLIQTARLSAMGELAAAVAHQVNNPLTTIVVDTELMLLNEQPTSPGYESLMAINRAGKRAAGVVRRLLAAARPTDPEAPVQPVELVPIIEEVVTLVKSHIERDRVRISLKSPKKSVPPVWAVPGQLDDVWLNLILNAHDALQGRDHAQISIEVDYDGGDYATVAVSDNGAGIPASILDEIFKPFFTTKPVGEGTGLGLHICRQIIERVGGSITVESVLDQGTRFLVRLPVKKVME